ncbi:MAG: hypothetical protein E6K96_09545 [Thaumarchaeota archaeon]|nr:MAG: hypothetical protein E6K96_09545 [Nitrososphaerota archaeon]
MAKISGKALVLILLFSIIETVVLTYWLVLLGLPVSFSTTVGETAAIFLFIGLLIEHLLAGISNKV